jgi:hypothetical protein
MPSHFVVSVAGHETTSHRDILCDTSGYARFPREPVADLDSLQRMTVGNLSGVAAKRPETEVYAGVLVTDNVFTDKSNVDVTLEQAEAMIAQTADLRKEFLLKVLRTKGILKDETIPEVIQEEELVDPARQTAEARLV